MGTNTKWHSTDDFEIPSLGEHRTSEEVLLYVENEQENDRRMEVGRLYRTPEYEDIWIFDEQTGDEVLFWTELPPAPGKDKTR